jgi:mRNA deadenylase 3'-5' endonuclease subunit Ccr4
MQTQYLLQRLEAFVEEHKTSRVLLAGDFNSLPTSAVCVLNNTLICVRARRADLAITRCRYHYITKGNISTHPERTVLLPQFEFTHRFCATLDLRNSPTHSRLCRLELQSLYSIRGEPITNWTDKFKGTIIEKYSCIR